jgi:type III restriction enzyme
LPVGAKLDAMYCPSNALLTKKQQAELLRLQVDTVGQRGKPGEHIQSVISVGMLSEGWDAKTVTHITGLRAFTSQLLCEQVVGRGLRRTAYELNPYTNLFEPEYINIFGVPFTFLPHESGEGTIPAPPKPKTAIEPDDAKAAFEISWPNVIRVDRVYRPSLVIDWSEVKPLELNASQTAKIAELAPIQARCEPDRRNRSSAPCKRIPHAEDHLRGRARALSSRNRGRALGCTA